MPNSNGVVDTNRANKTLGHHIHNYSTFNKSLSYRLNNTHRFGDYIPTFVMDGVPSDEIRQNSLDHVDSLSLKAPFKGSIRKIKESFMVPLMAILPMQWDRIYAQNSNGSDVPLDANCILLNFPANFRSLFSTCVSVCNSAPVGTQAERASWITAVLRALTLGEYVYSAGSLLNCLGYKASTQFVFNDNTDGFLNQRNFDWWYDRIIDILFTYVSGVTVIEPVGSGTRTHTFTSSNIIAGYEPLRGLLELFRENPLCYVSAYSLTSPYTESSFESNIGSSIKYPYFSSSNFRYNLPDSTYTGDPTDVTSLNPNLLNLSRLLAYQLVCAHFYTNSSIDFIYSAELYREYISSLTRIAIAVTPTIAFFTWNGISLNYDYLSGSYLLRSLCLTGSYLTSLSNSILQNSATVLSSLAIWAAIFGYRKSLRYGDYFTASRPRPLAPINTDVSVNSNLVSVIDITRNIQAQRFANAVMRSRSKIEEYVKSLFGKAPQPDYHNPFFLSRVEEFVFGDAVQNTAANQVQDANSRTSNFASNLGRHTFTFHNDDMHPCVYLQIVSYDTPRAYTRSVDRQFLHADRFDMFNPDFQYIGDQPIYGIELGYNVNGSIPNVFSYQSRDMEYKQRYDVSSGGFACGKLPGWSFDDSNLNFLGFNSISPDFIRSRNVDLDSLFLSLTGWSLGNYFHFVCITDNNVDAKRPMAVDPQILA